MEHLLAICGPKGVGKSTLATQLKARGYVVKKFADPIKLMLGTLLTFQGLSPDHVDQMLEGSLKEIPTKYFEGKSPRYAMQTLGTEWRDLFAKTLWTNVWKRTVLAHRLVVVDDMRFLHEVPSVRELGGKIVEITRQGFGPGTHPSEYGYMSIIPDLTISNNGTPEDMLRQLERASL